MDVGAQDPLPDWVNVIRISQHMGIPPWEIEHAPKHWIDKYMLVLQADEAAKKKDPT